MGTVVYLVGPKAVGKSWAGAVLEAAFGVKHVDADPLILALMAKDVQPHPVEGWTPWVQPQVEQALATHAAASVEATGAYEADFDMADSLESMGHKVLRVWLTAPEDETLARLRQRTVARAPTTEARAREIYRNATAIAARRRWDVTFDTSGEPRPEQLIAVFEPLLHEVRQV